MKYSRSSVSTQIADNFPTKPKISVINHFTKKKIMFNTIKKIGY